MRRFWAALGSLLFFVIAPGTIVGLVPWSITDWQLRPAFFGFEALRLAGAALMLLGLILLVESFARFVWKGFGTPAPIAPPTKLVMTGFYRRVRNPIMSALLRSSSVKRSFLAMTSSSSMQQFSGCFFTFGCWSSRNPRSSAHLATSSRTSRPMFRVGCLGLERRGFGTK